MSHINLLRSFMPGRCDFGINEEFDDKEWHDLGDGAKATVFQTKDQFIVVLFWRNVQMNAYELGFTTTLKCDVYERSIEGLLMHAQFARNPEMYSLRKRLGKGERIDANRGTQVFRRVVYVLTHAIHQYQRIVFNGAYPELNPIYKYVVKLPYVEDILRAHGMVPYEDQNYLVLERKIGI